MLDSDLKPWILEVNHSCSFHCDAQLDKEVKEGVILDAMKMLNLKESDAATARSEDKCVLGEIGGRGVHPDDDDGALIAPK